MLIDFKLIKYSKNLRRKKKSIINLFDSQIHANDLTKKKCFNISLLKLSETKSSKQTKILLDSKIIKKTRLLVFLLVVHKKKIYD
jgi:hypothetical protein